MYTYKSTATSRVTKFGKISQLCVFFSIIWQFSDSLISTWKDMNMQWQFCYANGQFFFVVNGQTLITYSSHLIRGVRSTQIGCSFEVPVKEWNKFVFLGLQLCLSGFRLPAWPAQGRVDLHGRRNRNLSDLALPNPARRDQGHGAHVNLQEGWRPRWYRHLRVRRLHWFFLYKLLHLEPRPTTTNP